VSSSPADRIGPVTLRPRIAPGLPFSEGSTALLVIYPPPLPLDSAGAVDLARSALQQGAGSTRSVQPASELVGPPGLNR